MTDFVSEADAVEQGRLVQEPLTSGTVDGGLPPDANEADVIEQAQPGPLLDEDEGR